MEHRQFVYLDDLAIQSLLASMGISAPEEVKKIREDTKEIEGEGDAGADIKLPYVGGAEVGAELAGSKTGREMLQTRKRISNQYVFDILHERVEDDIVIPSKEGMTTEDGKIVKMTGNIQTDAIYRLLKGISMMGEIMDLDGMEQIQTAEELLYKKGIGVSIKSDETHTSCAATLNPEKLWIDEERAFLTEKEYTVFGRVYDTFGGGGSWDYLDVIKIADTVIADETMSDLRDAANEFITALGQTSEEYERPDLGDFSPDGFRQLEQVDDLQDSVESTFELSVDEREIAIDGPGVVIDPIAIYW